MSRRNVRRVPYYLDSGGIKKLPPDEIKAILRGADDIIVRGGRNLLSKILKGSKEKKIFELHLDESPVYGYFKDLTIKEILTKIDWLIINRYLAIEYDYRLPVLVYTQKGWEIEKETYADELLEKMKSLLDSDNYHSFVMSLKDRDRKMILLLLDKIQATGNKHFIPILEYWATIDYKKVRKAIRKVIDSLVNPIG